MCEASNQINNLHLHHQVSFYIQSGKTEYFTDSVTYKKGTVILEESQQLEYAVQLAKQGIQVTIQESEEVTQILKNTYGDLFNYV